MNRECHIVSLMNNLFIRTNHLSDRSAANHQLICSFLSSDEVSTRVPVKWKFCVLRMYEKECCTLMHLPDIVDTKQKVSGLKF